METKISVPYEELKCTKEKLRTKIENELDRLNLIYNLTINYSTDSIKVLMPGKEPAKGVFEFKESELELYLNLPWLPEETEIKGVEETLRRLAQ